MSHVQAITLLIALAFTSSAVADDASPKRTSDMGKKAVTVISLVKLGGKLNAETLKLLPESATTALVDDGQSLLVYADEKTTSEIVQFIHTLEDALHKKATVVAVPGIDPEEIALKLRKFFPQSMGVTILPVRGEEAVIVYATEPATQNVRQVILAVCGIANEKAKPKTDEKRYTLEFKKAAWGDVFKWYAEVSGLTGMYSDKPAGTVTVSPPKGRQYTLSEATDLINEALAPAKYILVRNAQTFAVWPADEPINRTLVPKIELSQLAQRGQTELVQVEFVLPTNVDAKTWSPELTKLLTPFGSVVPFRGKILILDTAGNVHRLTDLLSAQTKAQKPVEAPKKPKAELKKFPPTTKGVPVPWETVLDWYADVSGLTPILPVMPQRSVELSGVSNREFTIAEITDLLNEALQMQRLILVRRQLTFYLQRYDERPDFSLIPRIDPSELRDRGKTELVMVMIPLKTLPALDTAVEMQKLLTPFGTISALEKLNTLVIVDTAGSLRNIRGLVQEIEERGGGSAETFKLRYRKAQEIANQLDLRFPDEKSDAGRKQSLVVTVDVKTNTLTIVGPPDKVQLAKKLIQEMDKGIRPGLPNLDPLLRKYAVPAGTADAVAKSLQGDMPKARLIALPATNEIMAIATDEEHAEIAKKLKSLNEDKIPMLEK